MKNMLRKKIDEVLVGLGDELFGVIFDLVRKLRADKDGVLLAGLKKLLRGEVKMVFPVWQTIKLGTFSCLDEIRRAVVARARFDQAFCSSNLKLSKRVVTVDLVKIAVHELGIENVVKSAQINERIKEVGLELCPIEAGPQLLLQYHEHRVGRSIMLLCDSDRDDVFHVVVVGVNADGVPYLSRYNGTPFGDALPPNCVVVLVRPRK